MSFDNETWITQVPKAELHAHLEGTITPRRLHALAAQVGETIPQNVLRNDSSFEWDDFAGFLTCYDLAAGYVRTVEDYYRITYDYLAESAAEGGIYAELIISADHAAAQGISYSDKLEALERAIDDAREDHDIEARCSFSMVRHYGVEQGLKTAELIQKHPHKYVTGFQMAGAEDAGPLKEWARGFAMAAEAGLGLHVHSGEWLGAESMTETLDTLRGPSWEISRIGHGVRCIEDPALVSRLADTGIVLEVCPLSNLALNVFAHADAHPFDRLRAAGVKVTLNSDDPPHFASSIGAEYAFAARQWGYDTDTLTDITRTAIEAAFVDEPTRSKLLQRLA